MSGCKDKSLDFSPVASMGPSVRPRTRRVEDLTEDVWPLEDIEYHQKQVEADVAFLQKWCEDIEAGKNASLNGPLSLYALSLLLHIYGAGYTTFTLDDYDQLMERCNKARVMSFMGFKP